VRGFGNVRWLAVAAAVALATGIVVPVLSGTGLASTGLASTAPAPGWRVTEVIPGGAAENIAASSATNAWLAAGTTKLLHWTGKDWQSVAVPAVIKNKYATVPFFALTPGQPSSAWAFGFQQNLATATNRGYAVHWTGKGWANSTLFAAGTDLQTAVAPAKNDVWAFGGSYALRYNGKKWSTAPSPGILGWSASALSASDIWLLGLPPGTVKGNFRIAIRHWNGKKWTAVKLPAIPMPTDDSAYPEQITAISDRNVWVAGTVSNPGSGLVGPDALLLHFNGSAWTRVTVPYPVGDPLTIASDGTGGIWLSGLLYGGTEPQEPYFFHDAGGQWTSVAVPAAPGTTVGDFSGMAAIPGTTSVWGGGSVISGTPPNIHSEGDILKYGR
jgi:hypothetical protein